MNLIDIVTHKVVERGVQACRWCPIQGLTLFLIFSNFLIFVLTHPSKPCFDFVFDLLERSLIFPNPSKRRSGELRALVVPLEKVSCRLILKICHVFLCQSLYQKFILHTVRFDNDICVHLQNLSSSSRFTLCDDKLQYYCAGFKE